MGNFQKELENLINNHSIENESNTPDFILAQYLRKCLDTFNWIAKQRDQWYGINLYPGCGIAERLKKQG